MTTNYLQRGTGRIAYDVQGDGPLVVCLPGMGDVRSLYRFLTPALIDAGYRVAAMDLRGHGDSDDSFDSFDDVALATDALALIEHLGGRAVIVGNSMGAGAAVWAAAEQPAAVAGLVLVGPFVRNPEISPLLKLMLRGALIKPWGPAFTLSYYRKSYPGRPPADLDEHVAAIRASLATGQHWHSFQATSRTSHAPAQERLGQVSAATLVVMGDKDADFSDASAEGRFVADALHAELLAVPDCGHYPIAEYPELVNPAVTKFLSGVYAGA